MFDTATLTLDSEQMTPLDDATLACIVGGEGLRDWLVRKVIEVVVDCLSGTIDEIIAAAEEGYADAR